MPSTDAPKEALARHDLLVFEADTSWMFAVPESGDFVIGRGDGADVRLQDASVSRTHARVSVNGPDPAATEPEAPGSDHRVGVTV